MMKERKLLLLVAHHKEDNTIKIVNKYFDSIQVGTDLSKKIFENVLHDNDAKDNISKKNKRYCELTAYYIAYKNIKAEYYGLMHYRRLFTNEKMLFNQLYSEIKFCIKKLLFCIGVYNGVSRVNNFRYISIDSSKDLEKFLSKFKNYMSEVIESGIYDIFVPKKIKFGFLNMEEQFILSHNKDDWEIFKEIVITEYPELKHITLSTFKQKEFYTFNMFIMKKKYFEEYMTMLFNILEKVENKVCFSDKNNYQNRLLGFLSERFFNIYINYLINKKNDLKIKELNTIFIKNI